MIMNCDKTRELMILYMDNELEGEELKSFEEHLKSCESCRLELEEITRVIELCAEIPEEDLPETFKEQLHKKLVDASRQESGKNKVMFLRNRYLKAITTVAAIFLVFVALSSIYGKDYIKGRFLTGSDKSAKLDMATESSSPELEAKSEEAADYVGILQSAEEPDALSSGVMNGFEGKDHMGITDGSTGTANDATRGFPDSRSLTMMAPLFQLKEIEVAVNADDVEKQVESIEKYGSRFGQETLRIETQSEQMKKSSKEMVEIYVVVPNTEYDMFIDALNNDSELSKMLSFGEIKNMDTNEYISNLNTKLDEINRLVEESEKSGDESEKEKAEKLAADRDGLKSIIDRISGNPDCTVVKFTIQKAG